MRIISWILLFASFIAIIASFVVKRSSSLDGGPLEIHRNVLEFGPVWVQEGFEWDVPIRNTTSQAIEIVDFRTSCKCSRIEPPALTVPARSTATIKLTLDLRQGEPVNSIQRQWPFTINFMPVCPSAPKAMQPWALHGVVRRMFTVSPPTVIFFDGLVYGEPYTLRRVRVRCFEPVKGLLADCDPTLATVAVSRVDEAGAEYDLGITPAESLPLGSFSFHVSLSACLGEKETTPPLRLPVLGSVVKDLRATPTTVFGGIASVGDVINVPIVLDSRTARPFIVTDVLCQSEQIVVDLQREEAEESTVFETTLMISVAEPGYHETEVVFIAGHQQRHRLEVPVAWYGN